MTMFLFEKPWLTTGADSLEEDRCREEIRLSQTKYGLKMLISAMSVLFFLIIVSYVVRMKVVDWQPLAEPGLLWFNTALLVLSSITMQLAVRAARRDEIALTKKRFLAAGLFTWAFLAGQVWAWYLLNSTGYFIATNPANTFFYMITALHGLHLLGGLGVWVYSMLKMRQNFEIIDVRSSVELCTTYWHFLLVVWVILYSLLLNT
ncbi:MAG: cytochrome c oxidase subunit 3 [Methylococcaceae bacterium]